MLRLEHGARDTNAKSRSGAPATKVRMRSGDPSLRPVFFVHDATGDVHTSIRLARLLPGTRPVHGVRARVDEDGAPADHTVEEMAAAVTQLVRTMQPTGAVTLMGYSFGAMVAYEAASSLVRTGRTVDRIVLLDPYVSAGVLRPVARWWFYLVQGPVNVLRWLPKATTAERRKFLRSVATKFLPFTGAHMPQINENSPTPEVEAHAKNSIAALDAYRPGRLDVPATIVSAEIGFPAMCDPLPTLRRLVRTAEIHRVRGKHADMMAEPDVRHTAELLADALADETVEPAPQPTTFERAPVVTDR